MNMKKLLLQNFQLLFFVLCLSLTNFLEIPNITFLNTSFNIDSDTVCVHVCENTSTAASEWTSTDKAYVAETLRHLNGLTRQTRHMWKHR